MSIRKGQYDIWQKQYVAIQKSAVLAEIDKDLLTGLVSIPALPRLYNTPKFVQYLKGNGKPLQ